MSEFKKSVSDFESFNDFFVREFKEGARPIFEGGACLPADARYRFFQNISKEEGFVVKGEKFCLKKFLGDEELAKRYDAGAMVMARLCPVDYHRFHFPCSGIAGKAKMINGKWFSVNPISLRENIHVMTENKRAITELDSEEFGKVLYVEIGATNVGSIVQTYEPGFVKKGEEKGYFGFGASALVILFEPGRVVLDADLIAATKQGLEIRALMGSSLGVGIAKK